MGANHTPGQWKADDYVIPGQGSSDRYIRSNDRHWAICAVNEMQGCTNPELDISESEAAANARLIAAAPDLLEAAILATTYSDAQGRSVAHKALLSAIAKATGK